MALHHCKKEFAKQVIKQHVDLNRALEEIDTTATTAKESEPKPIKIISNRFWPYEFTHESVVEQMTKFIEKASLSQGWFYCINFVEGTHRNYEYEVIFSLPTPRYPIPRFTASVYFHFTVSSKGVRAVYNYEGNTFLWKPEEALVSADLLANIIDDKKAFLEEMSKFG